MWDRNPNFRLAREKKKKKRKKERERERESESFPMKSSNLRHCQPAHITKDWAKTRGELAGCRLAHPLPEARGRRATARAGKGQSASEIASFTKLRAGSQLLTKSSWDPGWLTFTRTVTARDQLPRGDTWHTWDGAPAAHPGNWAAGKGGGDNMHCPTWGECTSQAPGHLSCADLGRAQNTGRTESVPLWSTWEPEPEWLRPGKCTQPRAHFRQFPCRATWSLSSVDWESMHDMAGGKPSVVKPSVGPTHTSDLFAVFLLPHNITEQVSLNKWPPPCPCIRAEIRHWRHLQTEEAKINRGNCFGSDRCNRLKAHS